MNDKPDPSSDGKLEGLQRMRALLRRFEARATLSAAERFELMREIQLELDKQREIVRAALTDGRSIEEGEYTATLDAIGRLVITRKAE